MGGGGVAAPGVGAGPEGEGDADGGGVTGIATTRLFAPSAPNISALPSAV